MGLIADTCIFIQAEKQEKVFDFSKYKDESVYISTITASELLVGVHRANNEERRLKRSIFIDTILSQIPTLDFTLEIARIHAEIYSYLARQGKLIGAHDLIIAATALGNNCSLLTYNHDEFKRVPGLTVLTF